MISPKTFERGDKKITVNIIEGNGWNFNDGDRNSQVIYSVVELFLNELSPELLFDGSITIRNHSSVPVCSSEPHFNHRTIYLHVGHSIWNQLAYQLAHELTHYFLKDNGKESANWFFEAIAETASLFFLQKMFVAFSISPDVLFQNYFNCLIAYRQRRMNEAPEVNLSPQDWYRMYKDKLLLEKTNRKLNLQAARMILPLFESLPGAWNALLFAPLENTPLDLLLPRWITIGYEGNYPGSTLVQELHSIFLGKGECQTACPKNPAG